jgi:hypothetical protein
VQGWKFCRDVLKYEASIFLSKCDPSDATPRVLHLHKRVIKKVIQLIYIASLNEAISSNNSLRLKRTIDIASGISTIAIGTPEKPGRYIVLYDKQKGEIGEVSFNDEWAQKLEGKLGEIIPLTLKEEESDPDGWLHLCGKLSYILQVLTKKQDFTNHEISKLQIEIATWSADWIVMCGREDMTNYTHLLIGSHICFFLRKWRNLYRYSNQGWEYQNKRIRNRYHHHTQSGGSSGTNGKRSSKIKPVKLLYLRVLHWMGVDKTSLDKHTIVGRLLTEPVVAVPEGEVDNDYVSADDMDADEDDESSDNTMMTISAMGKSVMLRVAVVKWMMMTAIALHFNIALNIYFIL